MSSNFNLMSLPAVTITGLNVSKISEQIGKNSTEFSFICSEKFTQYKIKVVPSAASSHDTGTQIPNTAGSVGMSNSGNFAAFTAITCTIKGADFKTAKGGSDGLAIVKVFVYDGVNWSA